MSAKDYIKVREWTRSMHRNCQYRQCGKPATVSCFRKSLGVPFVYCRDHAVLGGIVEKGGSA